MEVMVQQYLYYIIGHFKYFYVARTNNKKNVQIFLTLTEYRKNNNDRKQLEKSIQKDCNPFEPIIYAGQLLFLRNY